MSHLVTIGERLYAESIELIRELVNNAYDADATDVHVTIAEDEIRVTDNGIGMDLDGLREYFTIGTPDKRRPRGHPASAGRASGSSASGSSRRWLPASGSRWPRGEERLRRR